MKVLNRTAVSLAVLLVIANQASFAHQTLDAVVVTANPLGSDINDLVAPVTVLRGDELAKKQSIATIKVGEVPEGISTDELTGNIYVANWSSNQVSVIDGKKQSLLMQIKTGDKSRAFGNFILKGEK
mgnify:CR=1 FL=1